MSFSAPVQRPVRRTPPSPFRGRSRIDSISSAFLHLPLVVFPLLLVSCVTQDASKRQKSGITDSDVAVFEPSLPDVAVFEPSLPDVAVFEPSLPDVAGPEPSLPDVAGPEPSLPSAGVHVAAPSPSWREDPWRARRVRFPDSNWKQIDVNYVLSHQLREMVFGNMELAPAHKEQITRALPLLPLRSELGLGTNGWRDPGYLPSVRARLHRPERARVLSLALRAGDNRKVRKVLANGVHPDTRDRYGRTPLMAAASGLTDPSMVKLLIELGASLNQSTLTGATPLMYAVTGQDDLRPARILLDQGASHRARDVEGKTALISAAAYASNPGLIDMLIESGASIHERSYTGYTPLMLAAGMNPNPEVARHLLRFGPDLNARNLRGETALIMAVEGVGDWRVIRMLIRAGADPSLTRLDGADALTLAKKHRHFKLMERIRAEIASLHVPPRGIVKGSVDAPPTKNLGNTALTSPVGNRFENLAYQE